MSAISNFITAIRTAVYGEQVRGAIADAIEQCYSDVTNPSLQTEAFQTALDAAYAGGILDIQTVTQISAMTNQNIIYRYNGTEAGKQKGLYYYSPLSSSWVLIGSEIHSVSNSSQMTDTNAIYKYTGTQTGMVQNSLYCYNGTAWIPIGSGVLTASTVSLMTNQSAIYKYTGTETGMVQNALYYHNGTSWVLVDSIVATDAGLTEENVPADAFTVGQKIEEINDAISDLSQGSEGGVFGVTLPKLDIIGDLSQMTAEKNEVTYFYKWENGEQFRTGKLKAKWQGDSSTRYPKKNFTIKFFNDTSAKRKDNLDFFNLGKDTNKWVFKANYIDPSHARNVVSARLWGDVVRTRKTAPPSELLDAPNYGATDGYPVEIYNNGDYLGLYSLIIPKDDWMIGADEDNPLHCMMQGTVNNQGVVDSQLATEFRTASTGGWECEIGTLTTELSNAFTAMITFVMSSTDEEFYADLNDHIDVESAIDYYLFAYVIGATDSLAKNLAMITYDGGVKWYCSFWDMDTTFGLSWDGALLITPLVVLPDGYQDTRSLLWERLSDIFEDEIQARYEYLRETVFDAKYIQARFDAYFNSVGSANYKKDTAKWVEIPLKNLDHTQYIKAWIIRRLKYVDSMIGFSESRPCTAIALDKSSIEFDAHVFDEITATVTPSNTTDEIVWTTSNSSVVEVVDGKLMPKANGTATITATCGEETATCSITVSDVAEVIEWSELPNKDIDTTNGKIKSGTKYAQTNRFKGKFGFIAYVGNNNYTWPVAAKYDRTWKFIGAGDGAAPKFVGIYPNVSTKIAVLPNGSSYTNPDASYVLSTGKWAPFAIDSSTGLPSAVKNYDSAMEFCSAWPILVKGGGAYLLTKQASVSFLALHMYTKDGDYLGCFGNTVYGDNIPCVVPENCFYVLISFRNSSSLNVLTQDSAISSLVSFTEI